MSYCITTGEGSVEAIIDDNCGMRKFLSIAAVLVSKYRVSFTIKEDNSDTIDWSFTFKRQRLKLHYNIYHGVSLRNCSNSDTSVMSEVIAGLYQ